MTNVKSIRFTIGDSLFKYFQMKQPLPEVPQKVAYYSFQELLDDANKLEQPWAVLRKTPSYLGIGEIDEDLNVVTKVIFEHSFVPIIERNATVCACYFHMCKLTQSSVTFQVFLQQV